MTSGKKISENTKVLFRLLSLVYVLSSPKINIMSRIAISFSRLDVHKKYIILCLQKNPLIGAFSVVEKRQLASIDPTLIL